MVRFVNSSDANGYYKTLGVSPDASMDEIKAAYYDLVKKLHPDRGGDEELYRFVVDIANVLLDPKKKSEYDSVGEGAVYIGDMEREELARTGVFDDVDEPKIRRRMVVPHQKEEHWACLTTAGFQPDRDSDAWIDFCQQVSPAVGYGGKIRVGVLEGGPCWPCDPRLPWGIFKAGTGVYTFVVFQRGIKPNRLHALCAMIDWQNHLQNQIRGFVPRTERVNATWLLSAEEELAPSTREAKN